MIVELDQYGLSTQLKKLENAEEHKNLIIKRYYNQKISDAIRLH